MNKKIIPLISKEIDFYPINKNQFFIHQVTYDYRIKISLELYNFLQLIDNVKDLETIISEYNLKYNSILNSDFAYDFLYNKLAKYGIIINENIFVKPSEKPNYLKLSFIFLNKDKVSKITNKLKYLFIPKIMYCLLALSLFLLFFSFYTFNKQIFLSEISKFDWLLFFIISFIGITFHEFGHASAAKYFGAKHGGIGGGFYIFIPVYFADVTDIWRLPKYQRIIVNIAGMYFELIYVILILSIGFLMNNELLIILTCIFSISILKSLNPFIRSDGYWILSDAIEKPNLMYHGFLKVKQIFKPKISWSFLDYFVLIYGLISYIFIIFFLYFVLIKNPNSIIYFPKNVILFLNKILNENSTFSVIELSRLIIPLLFFYLVFGFIKNFLNKKYYKNKKS